MGLPDLRKNGDAPADQSGGDSDNITIEGQPDQGHGAPLQDNADLRQVGFVGLLDALGVREDERVAVCWQPVGGAFTGSVPRTRAESIAVAQSPHSEGDRWFGVNPVAVPEGYLGRGTVEHVSRAVALWGDFDVKDGRARGLEDARTVVKAISERILAYPVAEVESGGGLHAYWPLDPDDDAWTLDTEDKRAAAVALYRRVHRLMLATAGEYGWDGLDNVSDLARVLRVPNTANHKTGTPRPVGDAVLGPLGPSGPLTYAEVVEALDAYGVPEYAEDSETLGAVVSPPREWTFGESTDAYVAAMIAGWATDTPTDGRHPWLLSQCVRLAAAHRLGRITADDRAWAVRVLDERFRWLLAHHGEPREPHTGEVVGTLAWGQEKASRKNDEATADEIGGARTDSAPAPGFGPECDQFWQSSDELRHILTYARSKQVGPWSVLGGVLVRRVAQVKPSVVLPSIVSGYSSLNLYVGLVGKPEAGKGFGPGRSAFADLPNAVEEIGIGSGEGVTHQFVTAQKAEGTWTQQRVRWSALFTTEEIDTLTALTERGASTISAQLRKAWSGEPLGFGYVGKDKAVRMPDHSYRACVLTGVQPKRAKPLLDESAGGLPQRFVYLPVYDPDAPDADQVPEEPAATVLPDLPPGWRITTDPSDPYSDLGTTPKTPGSFTVIEVDPAIKREIRRARKTSLEDTSFEERNDEPVAHRNLMRLRLAAALMLLEGRSAVTTDDWRRADLILRLSEATAEKVRKAIRKAARDDNRAAGAAQAEREAVVAEHAETSVLAKVSSRIKTVLGKPENTDGMWHSKLRTSIRITQRDYLDDALDALCSTGDVVVEVRRAPKQKGGAGRWVRLP